MPILHGHVQELEVLKAWLEGMAKEKGSMVEEASRKQTALDYALQQQGDSDKELVGVKERLEASTARNEETAQVCLCLMMSTFGNNDCCCECLRTACSHV